METIIVNNWVRRVKPSIIIINIIYVRSHYITYHYYIYILLLLEMDSEKTFQKTTDRRAALFPTDDFFCEYFLNIYCNKWL